jgi:transmembrane sensor
MDTKKAQGLLNKYRNGTLSPEEKAILDGWYLQLTKEQESDLNETDLETKKAELYERLVAEINPRPAIRNLWPRIAAAASIVFALSFGGYLLLHKQQSQQTAQNQIHDIAPGGNKALLTLSNGQQVSLTDAKQGTIAKQGTTNIQKTADGKIVYNTNQKVFPTGGDLNGAKEIAYNTMATPRGGRYEATLADGTHFVLDAASSIKYPVTFTGKERIVEITGQVYFEVKHDSAHPFKVTAKGQAIEDIGTQFNVNAYDDEPNVKTTLVEGGVKVSQSGQSVILKPGQQAVGEINNKINVISANIDQVIAWKDGMFQFDSTPRKHHETSIEVV